MNVLSRVCSLVVFIAVFIVHCSRIVLLLVMHACIFIFHCFTFSDVFFYSSDSDWRRIKMFIICCAHL